MFYKLRHIPSGLFFKPSRHGSKSNLSKAGKVYQKKPSFQYLGNVYHHPATHDLSKPRWQQPEYESRPVVLNDWEIVEIKVND